jgi:hypothetical protein
MMETLGRPVGIVLNGIARRPRRGFGRVRLLMLISITAALAALIAFAFSIQGCANGSSQTASLQTAEPTYPGPAEYAAYGYPDDSYAMYNPFFYSYCCSIPYYYYAGGGSNWPPRKPPHLPLTVGSLPERLPPPGGTELAQHNTLTAQSTQPASWTSPRISPSGDAPANGSSYGGFGGGGFHGVGFGGFPGSAHR